MKAEDGGAGASARQRKQAVIAIVAALAGRAARRSAARGGVWLLVGLVGLELTAGGGWVAVTERMPRRAVGIVIAVVGVPPSCWLWSRLLRTVRVPCCEWRS